MKTLIVPAIILILFGISSSAQEVRNEVTLQGSGFFNKQTTAGGIVGPLPCIAQVHVMTDRDHDPAFVVVDRAPVWRPPGLAFFVGNSTASPLPAGYLEPLVQIVNRVEDRVVVRDVHNGAVGEHLAHAGDKNLPLV